MRNQDGSSKDTDTLRRQNERLRARIVRLSQVSRRITETWDLDTVLQEVVDGSRSLTNAGYGALAVFDLRLHTLSP